MSIGRTAFERLNGLHCTGEGGSFGPTVSGPWCPVPKRSERSSEYLYTIESNYVSVFIISDGCI